MPGLRLCDGSDRDKWRETSRFDEKIYPNRDSDSDSRRRPPRASTCVVCEGESISNGSTHLGRVRGRVLALARPIGPQQLDGPAGRIDASSKGWMGLVKLLPRLVVKRPRPRDTLNDESREPCPVLVHDAESAHLRSNTTSRRGARGPASCCACELPSLANSHARVRGRVTFRGSWPSSTEPHLRDNSARKKKVLFSVLLPSPGSSFVRSLRLHIFSQRRALSRRPLCRFSSS